MHPSSLPVCLSSLLILMCSRAPTPPEPATMGPPTPPIAAARPQQVRAPHGAIREDEYYWLRDDDRRNPEVLAHLEAENAYTDAVLAPLLHLQESVYGEIVGRMQQEDTSVPYRERGWWYYLRYESSRDYPVYARRRDVPGLDARTLLAAHAAGDLTGEEILLDANELAASHDYYQIGDWEVSRDGSLLAWTEDLHGRRQYRVRFRSLAGAPDPDDVLEGVAPDIVWADDGSLLYVENDPETLLTRRVKRHRLDSPAQDDALLYEEPDDSYYLGIGRSRDDRFLLIAAESTLTSELRFAPAADPRSFAVLAPRERGVEYQADHLGGRWLIRTNAGNAANFRLMEAPTGARNRDAWSELVPHREDVLLEDFELFEGWIALMERCGGLPQLRVLRPDGSGTTVAADEPAYDLALEINAEADSAWLRYDYASLTTPPTTYAWNVDTGERRLLRRQPVPGYDPAAYVTERIWAPARDGARIPVSLVYRRGFVRNGTAALLQYGYGSYGSSTEPDFDSTVISLLDRGMVYAIAHVRGGQELGRAWYEAGRLQHKENSFTDFIDVTEFLVGEGYAAPDRVAAWGGSAGGLLVAAAANLAPERYRVVLSQVPFVDVVTTMLDPSIPLTTNEYDEWGNPEKAADYATMLRYSPYDNLGTRAYPAMFVATGLWDSQVQYWEPAKYVARLRDRNTGNHPVVLRIHMDAGHGGKSGRFRRQQELAEMFAFLLDQLGVPAG